MSFDPLLDSIRTTDVRSTTPTTKAGGIAAVFDALDNVVQIGTQVHEAKQKKAVDTAEQEAFAMSEEELSATAEAIAKNPNYIAGSGRVRRFKTQVILERNAARVAADLGQTILEDGKNLGDQEYVDSRIAEARGILQNQTPKELQGAALSAFDQAMHPYQAKSAEASVKGAVEGAKRTVADSVFDKLDEAAVLAYDSDDEGEQREHIGFAVDALKDYRDGLKSFAINDAEIDVETVQSVTAWMLDNPELANDVVAELTEGDDAMIRDAGLISVLKQAEKKADAQIAKATSDRNADINQAEKEALQRARDTAGTVLGERRDATAKEEAQMKADDPSTFASYRDSRDNQRREQTSISVLPKDEADLKEFEDNFDDPNEAIAALRMLAETEVIPWERYTAGRNRIMQTAALGPYTAYNTASFITDQIKANNENMVFDQPTGDGYLREFREMTAALPASVQRDPAEFMAAATKIGDALLQKQVRDRDESIKKTQEDAQKKGNYALPILELEEKNRTSRTKLDDLLAKQFDSNSPARDRLAAQEAYAELYKTYKLEYAEMRMRQDAEIMKREGRKTWSEIGTRAWVFDQPLPSLQDWWADLGAFSSSRMIQQKIDAIRKEQNAESVTAISGRLPYYQGYKGNNNPTKADK